MLKKCILPVILACLGQYAHGQECAYAGRDTQVCGLTIDLIGLPPGGFWTFVCTPGAQVSLDSMAPGNVRMKAAACGTYQMVYHITDPLCPSSDTVRIDMEDRSFKFEEIKNNLSLQYHNAEDYDVPLDSCSHIRKLKPIREYKTAFKFYFEAKCESYSANQSVNGLDVTNCLAQSITSDVLTSRKHFRLDTTAGQDAFMSRDSLSNETNEFSGYYAQLLNSFLKSIDSLCPLTKCFSETPRCIDTLGFDSVWIDLPIFRGGQWHYYVNMSWLPLRDTNFISYHNKSYAVILPNGSRNYSGAPLTLVAYDTDSALTFKHLSDKLRLTVRWIEKWDTHRVFLKFPRTIIENQCFCNGRNLQFLPFSFQEFQFRTFKEIPLAFIPKPTPKITGDTVFCDGEFSTLSTDTTYAKYNWSNGDDQPTTFVFNSTNLWVEVSNQFGCKGSDTVEIREVLPPKFDVFASKREICNGQCVELSTNADSGLVVVWNVLDTLPKITVCPSITQRYDVTVINDAGCFSQDLVEIKVTSSPSPKVGKDKTLTCRQDSVLLDIVRADTNRNRMFYWEGPGIGSGQVSLLEPVVRLGGIYVFKVTDTITGCTGSDTLLVMVDTVAPYVNAGPDMVLSCNAQAVQLRGDSSQFGQGFIHEWSGPGIFSFNRFMINPLVEIRGQYVLRIINLNNDCVGFDTVQVLEDKRVPTADAGTPKLLYCDSAFITLGGPNTSVGHNFFYVWSGPGITLANRNHQQPQVNQAGRYRLVVINTDNFCNDTDFVEVKLPADTPFAAITKITDLGCGIDTVVLSSSISKGQNLFYRWIGPQLDTGSFEVKNWKATRAGIYTLRIRDTLTHCESEDTASVIDKGPNPFVGAGPDKEINCQTAKVLLEGTVVHPSQKLHFEWSGPGITATNRSFKRPIVDTPGTYVLYALDSISGCFASDTVTITKELLKPIVDLGPDIILTCDEPHADVIASISNLKPEYYFEWQGPGITDVGKRRISQEFKEGGTYVFFVSTGNPDCFASDTLRVSVDTAIVRFAVPDSFLLNCTIRQITIKIDSFEKFGQIFWFDQNNQLVNTSRKGLEVELVNPGKYKIRSLQSNGCFYEAQTELLPYKNITAKIRTDTICHNRLNGYLEITEIDGHGPFTTQLDHEPPGNQLRFEKLKAGEHTITIYDARGCSESFRAHIPNFPILMKPDTSIYHIWFCTDTIIKPSQLNIETKMTWLDNPSLKPVREFKRAGQYLIQYEDINRCERHIVEYNLRRIEIDTSLLLESIPNVFTPDGDRNNDVFRILFPDYSVVENFHMKIFNRFGQLLYQSFDKDGAWDGTYKGQPVPVDTYMVLLNGTLNICASNRMAFQFKIGLSLIR